MPGQHGANFPFSGGTDGVHGYKSGFMEGKTMVRFGTFISENILLQLGPVSHFEIVLPWIKLIKGNYEYVYNLCVISRCFPMVSSPLWPAGEVKQVSENFHFIQLNKSLTKKRTRITQ